MVQAPDPTARDGAAVARDPLRLAGDGRIASAIPVAAALVAYALGAPASPGPVLALALILVPGLIGLALRFWLGAARRRRLREEQPGLLPWLHLGAVLASGAALGAGLWLALRGSSAPGMALMAAVAGSAVTVGAHWRLPDLRAVSLFTAAGLVLPGLSLLLFEADPALRWAGGGCLVAAAGVAAYAAWLQRHARPQAQWQLEAAAARADAQRARRQLELALDRIESGFALYDAQDRLVVANAAYAQMIGLDPAWCTPGIAYRELLERWVQAHRLTADEARAFIDGQLARHRSDASRVELPMEQGRTVRVVKHVTPQHEVVALLTDLTEERARAREVEAARALAAEAAARLKASIEAHRDAFSIWTADARLVDANEAFRTLFHHVPAATAPGSTWREAIMQYYAVVQPYPESSPQFAERLGLLLRLAEAPGFEHEIKVHPDRWLRLSSGRAPGGDIVIVATDITALKQHAIELAAARDEASRAAILLQESIDAIDQGLSIWSPDGTLKMCNQAYRALVGDLPIALGPGTKFEALIDLQFERYFRRRGQEDLSFWPERRERLLQQLLHPPGTMTVKIWSGRWRTLTTSRNSQGDTVMLTVDVTELKQQAIELAAARDAAEAADRAKSSFLATMSHEIRTPMNGVLGMLEVLGHHALDAPQRELLGAAQESARTLLHLIDEVLDFSKIEAGALQLDAIEFSLSALVAGTLQSFRAAARAKHLNLSSAIDPGSSDVLIGDPARIRQVLVNLVGNAIKFTDAGRVALAARTQPLGAGRVELQIEVEDSGIGIAPEQAARLFQPFAQADGSITRRFGGTGLGLSIVQRLARAMDGDIALRSEPGKGSAFSVRLQLAVAPAESSLRWLDEAAAASAPAAAAPPLGAMCGRALVVDDHPINRRVLVQQLRLLGVESLQAEDGDEALAAVERDGDRIDIVLCDVHMPRVDGYEFARRLRARGDATSRLPVVAVTAHVLQGEAERCLAAGMDGYLGKPVALAQLRATLARWLPLEPGAEGAGIAPAADADYDAARLASLYGEDRAAIAATLDEFRRSAEREIERAGQALRQGDLAAVAVAGHRLKGAAANVGAPRLAACAANLESAGRTGLGSEAQVALGEASAALRRALAASGAYSGQNM